MTDYRDKVDDGMFYGPFAHAMICSGRCIKKHCPHYEHSEPKITCEECRVCYAAWKDGRL